MSLIVLMAISHRDIKERIYVEGRKSGRKWLTLFSTFY